MRHVTSDYIGRHLLCGVRACRKAETEGYRDFMLRRYVSKYPISKENFYFLETNTETDNRLIVKSKKFGTKRL